MIWRCWALACAWMLGMACGIRDCERERLENTTMRSYGPGTNKALEEAGIDGIYIVHYSGYPDRRLHMESWLNETGLRANFVTGWDREVAEDEDVKCMWPSAKLFERVALERHFETSWLEVRELTLAMKHASAWYAAVKNGHRHTLILEDDSMFAPDFIERLRDMLANETLRSDYDLIHLGSFYEDNPNQTQQLVRDKGHRGAAAYLLSAAGAEHMIKQDQVLTGTADHMISNQGFYPNVPPRRWMYRPWLVWQGSRGKSSFGKNGDYKLWCWTPDMHECKGIYCPMAPKFYTEHLIGEGLIPCLESVRVGGNGTVLTVAESVERNWVSLGRFLAGGGRSQERLHLDE